MTLAVAEHQLTFDLDALVADCITIAREEHGGVIRSKWAMGARILQELDLLDEEGTRKRAAYGAAAIQKIAGAMEAEFGDEHGYGRTELYCCIQFAERIPEGELSDAVGQFKSWRRIEHELLGNGPSVHFSSESAEWLTPQHIVDRVAGLFGQIDLDPCSPEGPTIPAVQHFSEDGLAQPWAGRVYMNPPYGRAIGDWVSKLVEEYGAGRVTEAIALVPARTDTEWFSQFRDGAVCFLRGRLKFSNHNNSAPFPSSAIYLGERVDDFRAAFGDLGDVWLRVR